MRRRPETKAVLLALADRCSDDGLDAWPSVATIAAESEIGVRIADACLASLRELGLIAEQAPPRQHRPRTWMLNLDAIAALSDTHDRAPLTASAGPQHAATLTNSGSQVLSPGPQILRSGSQISTSGSQHVADEQSSLNEENSLNGPLALVKTEDADFHEAWIRARNVANALKRFHSFVSFEDLREAVAAELPDATDPVAIDHGVRWAVVSGPEHLRPVTAKAAVAG